MNETDVREVIVRPILNALGYAHGAEAYVKTERTLRYANAFLGRKKPDKDRPLTGRADYECGVISHGRWIVEVKPPTSDLSIDDAQQAHTYAAHPEIAAELYLLTNGREFRLYQKSYPEKPAFSWLLSETTARFDIIENLLGPDAVRNRARNCALDVNKPLAVGVGSQVRFVGGTITYSDYRSPLPEVRLKLQAMLQGHRATVQDGSIRRTESGLLSCHLKLAQHFSALDAFNKSLGLDGYVFEAAAPYVSRDPERPTILQNHMAILIAAGTVAPSLGGAPPATTPFTLNARAETEAVGFIDGDELKGVFNIRYSISAVDAVPLVIGQRLAASELETSGEFAIRFQNC